MELPPLEGKFVGNYFLLQSGLTESPELKINVATVTRILLTDFPRTKFISPTNFNKLVNLVLPYVSSLVLTEAAKEERIKQLRKYLYLTPSQELIGELENYTIRDGEKFNINVSFIPEFRDKIFAGINRILTDQLSQVKIVPGTEAALQKKIQEKLLRSLIPPGEALGVITGQSSIAPQSQAALNSNHNISSSKNLGGGVVQINETFDLSKNRKLPITNLHFQNKFMSWDEVYQYRYKYVNVMLKELLNPTGTKNILYDELTSSSGLTRPVTETRAAGAGSPVETVVSTGKWWFPYPTLKSFEQAEGKTFLPAITALTFYPNKVFLAHLTMRQIATAIENYINVPQRYIKCVPSSIAEGIIYIFTYADSIQRYTPPGTDSEGGKETPWLEPQAFNEIAIISRLDNISLSGVPEIKSLYPTTISLKGYFMEEVVDSTIPLSPSLAGQGRDLREGAGGGQGVDVYLNPTRRYEKTSRLYFSPPALRSDCIPVTRLIYLLRVTGINVIDGKEDYFTIKYMTNDPAKGAVQLMSQQITAAEKAVKDYQTYLEQQSLVKEEQREGIIIPTKKDIFPKPTEEQQRIYKFSRYVYAQIIGANLTKFLQFPEVDSRYTYTNVFQDILKFWDIEALRNYLYREIYSLFVNMETPIHYSIAMRIASYMTTLGFGIPLTHVGVGHRPGGPLAKASMDRPLKYILPGAAAGFKDSTNEVSTAVLFGAKFHSGTGLVGISLPPAVAADNEFTEYVFPENGFGRELPKNLFEGMNFTYTGKAEAMEPLVFAPIRGSGVMPQDYAFLPPPIAAERTIPDILLGTVIEM
jgi:hypothetical protein